LIAKQFDADVLAGPITRPRAEEFQKSWRRARAVGN
jgi:hypothetical protein